MPRLIEGHTDTVSSLAFSPGGKRLASGGWDNSVRIWDSQTGHELLYLSNENYFALDAEFSPDGLTLASTDSGPRYCSRGLSPEPTSEKGVTRPGVDSLASILVTVYAALGMYCALVSS